ncbi:hypothetical protein [Herbiconiux sp. L3-i23]|uniref:hypothetical protein n=1 Tax=Herbiconiux sp. L3-i23 TaxID=2905871 RepID=UPI002068A6E3|nr:hypothetical protein [Herbiconiux sp. L3-i23]BDI23684.1 hypothetical protein L3i23_24600 [Herbiconiux sp. L3-i23]
MTGPADEDLDQIRAVVATSDGRRLVSAAVRLTELALSPSKAKVGPPSPITSIYTWYEEITNDTRQRIPFERRLAERRPELSREFDDVADHPDWPRVRLAVARVIVDGGAAQVAALLDD